MSKAELARAAGVKPPSYQAWEDGRVVPKIRDVERLARYLGVRACWLAFGEGPMTGLSLDALADAVDAVPPPPDPAG